MIFYFATVYSFKLLFLYFFMKIIMVMTFIKLIIIYYIKLYYIHEGNFASLKSKLDLIVLM